MLKYINSRLSMIQSGESFYDSIGKYVVYIWIDCYFEKYMAKSKFGHRVKL